MYGKDCLYSTSWQLDTNKAVLLLGLQKKKPFEVVSVVLFLSIEVEDQCYSNVLGTRRDGRKICG